MRPSLNAARASAGDSTTANAGWLSVYCLSTCSWFSVSSSESRPGRSGRGIHNALSTSACRRDQLISST